MKYCPYYKGSKGNSQCKMQNAKCKIDVSTESTIENMIVGDDLRVVPLTLDEERAQWADTQVGPYEM